MELYHGSLEVVQRPRLLPSAHGTDFGSGFYTTTSFEQAARLAARRMAHTLGARASVNVYECDTAALARLDVLRFEAADHDWLMFVKANRTELGFRHDHDAVIGPVADDQELTSFALFANGLLSEEGLLGALLTHRLVDQWLFHSQAALDTLTFIQAKDVHQP